MQLDSQETHLPSAGELLKQSIGLLEEHFTTIVCYGLLPFVFYIVLIFLEQIRYFFNLNIIFLTLNAVITIAFLIAIYIAQASTIQKIIDIDQNKELDLKTTIFTVKNKLANFIGLQFLTTAIVFICSFLFIAPGIYVSLLTTFAAIVFFTEDKDVFDSIVSSWYYVKNYWWSIFFRMIFLFFIAAVCYWLIVFVFASLGAIAFFPEQMTGITVKIVTGAANFLIFIPFSYFYLWTMYKWLRQKKGSFITPEIQHEIRTRITIFIVLGLFAALVIFCLFISLIFPKSNYFLLQAIIKNGRIK